MRAMGPLDKCLIVLAALYVFVLPWAPLVSDAVYAVFVAYVLFRVRNKKWDKTRADKAE